MPLSESAELAQQEGLGEQFRDQLLSLDQWLDLRRADARIQSRNLRAPIGVTRAVQRGSRLVSRAPREVDEFQVRLGGGIDDHEL